MLAGRKPRGFLEEMKSWRMSSLDVGDKTIIRVEEEQLCGNSVTCPETSVCVCVHGMCVYMVCVHAWCVCVRKVHVCIVHAWYVCMVHVCTCVCASMVCVCLYVCKVHVCMVYACMVCMHGACVCMVCVHA